MVSKEFRNLMSMGVQIAFGVSYMLFAFFSYYIRDWRQFYWVGGAIGLVYIPYIWFVFLFLKLFNLRNKI